MASARRALATASVPSATRTLLASMSELTTAAPRLVQPRAKRMSATCPEPPPQRESKPMKAIVPTWNRHDVSDSSTASRARAARPIKAPSWTSISKSRAALTTERGSPLPARSGASEPPEPFSFTTPPASVSRARDCFGVIDGELGETCSRVSRSSSPSRPRAVDSR